MVNVDTPQSVPKPLSGKPESCKTFAKKFAVLSTYWKNISCHIDVDVMQQPRGKRTNLNPHVVANSEQVGPEVPSLHFLEFLWPNGNM